MITFKKLLSLRMSNRFATTQRKIQKLLIEKANELRICLLSIDMMAVVRDNEKFAIANILPAIRPTVGQLHDYAFAYLDLPATGLDAGFYRIQLAEDRDETMMPLGILVDETGQFVRNIRYFAVDVLADLVGGKSAPEKRLTIFETFSKTNETYIFGGTHADGQAFVIVL